MGLKGKTVLVIGGTGGIGKAVVQAFLAKEAYVHFCGYSKLSRTERDLAKAFPRGQFRAHHVDASDATALRNCVQLIAHTYGGIDVVVANVSGFCGGDNDRMQSYATDLQSLDTLCTAAIPHLTHTRGNIVAFTSIGGRNDASAGPAPYGAITAGVTHFMTQLACTLAPRGVRANIVSPDRLFLWNSMPHEDVANAVVWIASDEARFVSGSTLVVDGALGIRSGS